MGELKAAKHGLKERVYSLIKVKAVKLKMPRKMTIGESKHVQQHKNFCIHISALPLYSVIVVLLLGCGPRST